MAAELQTCPQLNNTMGVVGMLLAVRDPNLGPSCGGSNMCKPGLHNSWAAIYEEEYGHGLSGERLALRGTSLSVSEALRLMCKVSGLVSAPKRSEGEVFHLRRGSQTGDTIRLKVQSVSWAVASTTRVCVGRAWLLFF